MIKHFLRTGFNWIAVAGGALILIGQLLSSAHLAACNYGRYGLEPGDSSQTTVDGLFQGIYEKQKSFLVQDWKNQVKDLESRGYATSSKQEDRLDYAWALHKAAANDKAVSFYQGMIKADPGNYEALCGLATTLHDMRQFTAATDTIKKAITLKPGFRNNAEEFHLAMIDYQQRSHANYKYAQDNVFVNELTPIWKNRKGTEDNFSTVDFPVGYKSEGMAELLRQYPNYGEAWLALGMLLEHEKDFSMAVKAYDRALQYGTAHATDLRRYMETFREFGRAHDTGRLAGKRVVQVLIGLAILAVLVWLLRIADRVVADITSARASKLERERMARRKHKDPDSPL